MNEFYLLLQVIINGPAHLDASSLKIIKPNIKYKLDIILSRENIYGRVVIRMAENFCTDMAGNVFTRTNGSTIVIRFGKTLKAIKFHRECWVDY